MNSKQKNIFITGAVGFIGSEFARQIFNDKNYNRIYLLDSLTYAADLRRITNIVNNDRVILIEGSINNSSIYRSALAECQEAVHFAAESHVDRSIADGFPFVETNILGSYIFLENCRENQELRTLFVSTDEVYGSVPDGLSDEASKVEPSSVYSASKSASDLLALANVHTHAQDLIITRCCNNYGPFQHGEKFIPTVINNILRGIPVPIYGSGNNIREWIHVSDHVEALKLLLKKGASGNIYNIGTAERITNNEMLKVIIDIMKIDGTSFDFVTDRKGHDFRYAIDSTKLKIELRWSPKFSLQSGITETASWYSDWYKEEKGIYT